METNASPSNEQNSFLKGFLNYLPVIQWVLTLFIAAAVFALSQRDLQTTQAQETRETARKIQALELQFERGREARDRQIESLKKEMLTREVFEAYHSADSERMNRIEKMLEQLLTNQNR